MHARVQLGRVDRVLLVTDRGDPLGSRWGSHPDGTTSPTPHTLDANGGTLMHPCDACGGEYTSALAAALCCDPGDD
jgi:hypothetical protein